MVLENLADVQATVGDLRVRTAILEAENDSLIRDAAEANDVPIEDTYDEDIEAAEAAVNEGGTAWDITGSGALVFSAGGTTAFNAVEALLLAILKAGHGDPSIISLDVEYTGPEDNDPYTFSGHAMVGI